MFGGLGNSAYLCNETIPRKGNLSLAGGQVNNSSPSRFFEHSHQKDGDKILHINFQTKLVTKEMRRLN